MLVTMIVAIVFFAFSKETVDKAFETFFGSSKQLNYNNLHFGLCTTASLRNNMLYINEVETCGEATDAIFNIRYDYSEYNNEDLYLYVDYEVISGSDNNGNYVAFSNQNNIKSYRLVFEKDNEGNYYWVSTTLI